MESFLRTHQQGCTHVSSFNGFQADGEERTTPAGHDRLRKALRYIQRWSRTPLRCTTCPPEDGWRGRHNFHGTPSPPRLPTWCCNSLDALLPVAADNNSAA